jgi:hypothetical protein
MVELNSTGTSTRAWAAGDELVAIAEGGGSDDTLIRLNGGLPMSFITGTKTQFNTAVSDGNIVYVGDQIDIAVDDTPSTPAAGFVGIFGHTRGGIRPAFINPDGQVSTLQAAFAHNKVGINAPNGNGTTVSNLGVSITATGTATTANAASTNVHTAMRRIEYAVTTASTTAVAGLVSGNGLHLLLGKAARRFGGFLYSCRFGRSRGVASNATLRAFNGVCSLNSAPTDVEPSTTVTDAIGVGCDAADTNWQIMHRTGSGTCTKIDTGFAKAVNDTEEMYELTLYSPANTTTRVDYFFRRLSDGASFSGSITTPLPADTTFLGFRNYYSVGGTSSVIGYAHVSVYMETDL